MRSSKRQGGKVMSRNERSVMRDVGEGEKHDDERQIATLFLAARKWRKKSLNKKRGQQHDYSQQIINYD